MLVAGANRETQSMPQPYAFWDGIMGINVGGAFSLEGSEGILFRH